MSLIATSFFISLVSAVVPHFNEVVEGVRMSQKNSVLHGIDLWYCSVSKNKSRNESLCDYYAYFFIRHT